MHNFGTLCGWGKKKSSQTQRYFLENAKFDVEFVAKKSNKNATENATAAKYVARRYFLPP